MTRDDELGMIDVFEKATESPEGFFFRQTNGGIGYRLQGDKEPSPGEMKIISYFKDANEWRLPTGEVVARENVYREIERFYPLMKAVKE